MGGFVTLAATSLVFMMVVIGLFAATQGILAGMGL
jgi:hypothetical protein